MPDKDTTFTRQLLRASSVGIQLVSATFVGFAIGYFLDKYLGTRPWLMIVFFFLGLFTGFRDLLRVAFDDSAAIGGSGDEEPGSGSGGDENSGNAPIDDKDWDDEDDSDDDWGEGRSGDNPDDKP